MMPHHFVYLLDVLKLRKVMGVHLPRYSKLLLSHFLASKQKCEFLFSKKKQDLLDISPT